MPLATQVWVYGIVLPRLPPEGDSAGASLDGAGSGCEEGGSPSPPEGTSPGTSSRGPGGDVVDVIACGMRHSGMTPGMVRPPALVAGEQGWPLVSAMQGGSWMEEAAP